MFSRYCFTPRVIFVIVIVPCRHILTRIRITILAQMRAGVVLADVLTHHAAAELPLAFVAVVAVLDDGRFGIEEVAFGNLHTEKIHQGLVVVGKANHQVIINAAIVLHTIKIGRLATGRQGVVPAFYLVQLTNRLAKSTISGSFHSM